MHQKERALLERHAQELAALKQELEAYDALPPGIPASDRVHVFRYPLFGTEGRLTWGDLEPKQAILLATLLAPYEPLSRCKQHVFTAFAAGPPPFPVVDDKIGPVLIEVDFDGGLKMKWVVRLAGKLWWIYLLLPDRWGKDSIGYRSLERASVRDDRIAYEHRPVIRCEWVRGTIPLREITRYGGGSPTSPNTFVLQFEHDWDPLRLLTTVNG